MILFNRMKKIYLLFILIFLTTSCKTIERKIDTLSKEEEKNLSKLLGKQQFRAMGENIKAFPSVARTMLSIGGY